MFIEVIFPSFDSWQKVPVNSKQLQNLNGQKQNEIESTLQTLIH